MFLKEPFLVGPLVLKRMLEIEDRGEKFANIVKEEFDLRPRGLIEMLDLKRPIYQKTAAYGHFGRDDIDLPWEKTDKLDVLKKYL